MMHELSTILQETLAWHHLTKNGWNSIRRTRELTAVRVKQVVSLIAFENGYSHTEIAEFLEQHRTTVIHHIKTLKEDCKHYEGIRDMVDNIRFSLNEKPFPQKAHYTTAYLARNSTGLLTISPNKPDSMGGYWMAEGSRPFSPQDSFPQITYETGPVRIQIKMTIDDETM